MPNGFAFPVDGGLALEKLWENEAPTAEFAAQTISLDFSKYDACILTAMTASSTDGIHREVTFIAFKNVASSMNNASSGSFGQGTQVRNFQISENSIQFFDARMSYNNQNNVLSNFSLIPYRIYGIKAKIT